MLRSMTLASTLLAATALSAATAPDGDQIYKNNCTRCHQAMRSFAPRASSTIVRHMRIKASLTPEEANAVLQYLTGVNSPRTGKSGGR